MLGRGNSRIQIAYLQGCTGMTSRQNFDTLLEMLREHSRLWALNMGELSGSVSPQMMQELLEAISDSNLVAFYYDTSPAFVELTWKDPETIPVASTGPGGTWVLKIHPHLLGRWF